MLGTDKVVHTPHPAMQPGTTMASNLTERIVCLARALRGLLQATPHSGQVGVVLPWEE